MVLLFAVTYFKELPHPPLIGEETVRKKSEVICYVSEVDILFWFYVFKAGPQVAVAGLLSYVPNSAHCLAAQAQGGF